VNCEGVDWYCFAGNVSGLVEGGGVGELTRHVKACVWLVFMLRGESI